jgi:hypothetical protein
MLPRMALRLGMACGLVLASPGLAVMWGQPDLQQSTQLGSKEERIIRRQTLDVEVQREARDQAELRELSRRLIVDDVDVVTRQAAKRQLQECQQKRRLSEQGLSQSPIDTRRPCDPNIQLWSML